LEVCHTCIYYRYNANMGVLLLNIFQLYEKIVCVSVSVNFPLQLRLFQKFTLFSIGWLRFQLIQFCWARQSRNMVYDLLPGVLLLFIRRRSVMLCYWCVRLQYYWFPLFDCSALHSFVTLWHSVRCSAVCASFACSVRFVDFTQVLESKNVKCLNWSYLSSVCFVAIRNNYVENK